MDKNIYLFINHDYIPLKTSNIIKRIACLVIYTYLIIITVEIRTPKGYDMVSFSADYALPYVIFFSVFAIIISAIIFIVHRINKYWTSNFIRGITYSYLSILALWSSLVSFDGQNIYVENVIFLILEIFLFILCSTIFLLIFLKMTIPKFEENQGKDNQKYLALIPSLVVAFRVIFATLNNDTAMLVFSLSLYLLSILFSFKSVEFLTKVYFAKKLHKTGDGST